MPRPRLPRTISVRPVDGSVSFRCPGCQQLHTHGWVGNSNYLPQCPPGTAYWRTSSGYWLEAVL